MEIFISSLVLGCSDFGLFHSEIVKESIVCYLRESGSAEGSVADTRDRKEWKSSSLHRRDLKTHEHV